jgi:imidazoleglycerol-phosphate dehydratase / histidinol-phosphatase
MKKALFIDRDGTLIFEPPGTEQVDSLDQLEFLPGVIRNMYLIRSTLDFELVIVTNQDGLGTPAYPQDRFDKVQAKMLKAFENEGVKFDEILIDKSTKEQNLPTRKPGTGMLKKYLNGSYDLLQSFVIGDRVSDVELAKNLGCRAIWLNNPENRKRLDEKNLAPNCALITGSWDEIYSFLALPYQSAEVKRTTKETEVYVKVALSYSGQCEVSTGLKFFDHMLEQIGRHAGIDLIIRVKGDLQVDEHHTIEDTAIALGEAIDKTIASKTGMARYGFVLPMDETLAKVAIDFGGRSWLVWKAKFKREKVGDMPAEMFYHFFKSFSDAARCNLNIECSGGNEHHMAEAIFKAFAKALRMAIKRDPLNKLLPSTKGVL